MLSKGHFPLTPERTRQRSLVLAGRGRCDRVTPMHTAPELALMTAVLQLPSWRASGGHGQAKRVTSHSVKPSRCESVCGGDTTGPATTGTGERALGPRPGRRSLPTLRAVLMVLHSRRRRVSHRYRCCRGAGRSSRARAGAAASTAQFRQSPVGGRELGSQVGHLLAGRLDRPIDAERELLIVFHHAQDFGLGAREVTKSCMMCVGGAWPAVAPALPVGSP